MDALSRQADEGLRIQQKAKTILNSKSEFNAPKIKRITISNTHGTENYWINSSRISVNTLVFSNQSSNWWGPKKVETCFAVIFVIKYIRHIYNCIPCIYKLFYQNLKLDAALVKVNA